MPTVCRLPQPYRPSRHTANQLSGRRRLRVLLATAANRGVSDWRAQLAAAGHMTVTVGDAEAMLDALSEDRFDVALLELTLPDAVEAAKLYQFICLGERSVPIIGLVSTVSELDATTTAATMECLALHAGPDEVAALEAMLSASRGVDAAAPAPAEVVCIETHRKLRERHRD